MPDMNYNPGNREPMGQPAYTPPTQPWAPTTVIPPKRHTVRNVLLIVVAALIALCGIGTIISVATSSGKAGTGTTAATAAAAVPAASKAASPTPPPATTKAAPPAATTKAAPAAPKLTVSQQQALGKAKDYLNFTHFSRKGLIQQLEYDGFSSADATYAVDAVGADWNAQAAGKAQDYVNFTHFSHASLVQQLEYDGFTAAQAEHGAAAVGL